MPLPAPDLQMELPQRVQNDLSAPVEDLKANSDLREYVRNVAESIVTPESNTSPPVNGFTSPRKRSLPDLDEEAEATTTAEADATMNGDNNALPASTPPKPVKRRKLTAAEKEEKQREKEEKEQQKAEKKQILEEEKRVKEEEKRRKDAERDEKRKLKEAETKAKEDKKREEEQEKAKKERAQTRLNNFFPALKASPEKARTDRSETTPSPSEPGGEPGDDVSGKSTPIKSVSPQKPTVGTSQSDYETVFLPFFVQAHVFLAPWNRFGHAPNLQLRLKEIDEALVKRKSTPGEHLSGKQDNRQALWTTGWRKNQWSRYRTYPSVEDLLSQITGSADRPIDLTAPACSKSVTSPAAVLKKIPIKHLQYAEDFRPAYRGTFSRLPAAKSALRLGRNPFERSLPDTDYDYDSEAEWVEPEEGEDLNSEGEEDIGSEEDDEDMDGFLDDEELDPTAPNPGNKRRFINGDLIPICSGICWEDIRRKYTPADGKSSQPNLELGRFRMELLLENQQLPIDPYSVSYWQSSPLSKTTSTTNGDMSKEAARKALYPMDPPRVPLHTFNRANVTVNQLAFVDSTGKAILPNPSTQGKRMISSEYLDAFKTVVQGSDLTKAGLIEVLKKRFPKASKDVIKDTLTTIASRVGIKEADKRWMLIDGV
ncbi:MAG: chromatin assembly factor-I (CAF-I) p90 subunit [Peltula sp. TS41687]|nr:MAG: chromatin assembly factor-I (CAF-I) p90 subunit [Peltula sp. TS41687]